MRVTNSFKEMRVRQIACLLVRDSLYYLIVSSEATPIWVRMLGLIFKSSFISAPLLSFLIRFQFPVTAMTVYNMVTVMTAYDTVSVKFRAKYLGLSASWLVFFFSSFLFLFNGGVGQS